RTHRPGRPETPLLRRPRGRSREPPRGSSQRRSRPRLGRSPSYHQRPMVTAAASPPVERRMDRVAIGTLAGGHLAVDFAQGAVPAMLPFFIQERRFSYAAAAGLVLAQTVSSSVVQP